MWDALSTVVKSLFIVGSLEFLLLGAGVGVVALFIRRWAVWARWWLAALVASYWLMSTPVVV